MKWDKLSADVAGVRVQPQAYVMDESPGPSENPEHVTFARLVRHSALELLLTFLMLFGVASIPHALRRSEHRKMGSRSFTDFSHTPGDPRRAADRRVGCSNTYSRADRQPARQGNG